jgi:hypothetical protein
MVRGLGSVALVLGLIPLVGAALMWAALGLADTNDGPATGLLVLALLGLTAVSSAVWAYRRGASAWAVLWGVAAGAAAVVFFWAIALVLISVAPSEPGGCPEGRIYC